MDPLAHTGLQNYPAILEQNITLPGASPLFPDAHCIASGEVCQLTLGEGGKFKIPQDRQGRMRADYHSLIQKSMLLGPHKLSSSQMLST